MASPSNSRSWADLQTASLYEILGRVLCPVDRHRAKLVCRAWRAAMDALELPRPPRALPWLLLPPTLYPDSGYTRAACCVLSACRVHHWLKVITPPARCFGSHDGAWLLLHFPETGAHQVFNARTGHSLGLPSALWSHYDPRERRVVFLAAALSAPPDDPRCIVAGIVSSWTDVPEPPAVVLPPPRQCRLVVWAMECPTLAAVDIGPAMFGEDVVYHGESFLFLSDGENLRVATPVRDHNGKLARVERGVRVFDPRRRGYEQVVHARYLVVSRGDVLMVVRFRPHEEEQRTSAFKVFMATERQKTDADDTEFPVATFSWEWSELRTLGGRMLFVGRGCSRSYEAGDYLGFKAGIYFLDDGEFHDEAVIFCNNGAVEHYRCSDNGKWSESDGSVQRCFPRPDPSNHSPPAWLLP